jgi:hypothetical protein
VPGVVAKSRCAARAVLGREAAHRRARCALGDEEQADPCARVRRAGDARWNDPRVGLVAGRDDALRAAEHPAGAGGKRPRLDMVEPIACSALLMRQHDQRRRVGDARQPRGLHAGRRRRQQQRGDQSALRVRCVDQAAAEFLADDHRLDRAESHAPVRGRNGQTGQPEFGEFGVDRTCGTPRLGERVAPLEREALFDPARDRVAQRDLVV